MVKELAIYQTLAYVTVDILAYYVRILFVMEKYPSILHYVVEMDHALRQTSVSAHQAMLVTSVIFLFVMV
jgi:hypothetical protein